MIAVQKLRLKYGWSQQQLAEISGLSVRTIQRIEAGNPPSVESLKSLAAAFDIDFETFNQEHTMDSATDVRNVHEEKQAFRHVRELRRFYVHLFRYILGVLILLAINLITSPQHLWVFWVMGGWGLGILMHASRVFGPAWLLGPAWERKQVEKKLGRPL